GSASIQLVLSTAVVFGAGARFFRVAIQKVRRAEASMDTLIALGAVASFGLSVFGLVTHDHSKIFFETAGAIVAFALVGRFLEERAKLETGDALMALYRLRPPIAHSLEPRGGLADVPIDAVRVGERLRVLPGERVPVDGIVRAGESEV